jgi:hypothetical protein
VEHLLVKSAQLLNMQVMPEAQFVHHAGHMLSVTQMQVVASVINPIICRETTQLAHRACLAQIAHCKVQHLPLL